MKNRRVFMTALVLLTGGCSEETKFNSAAGGRLIEAERIIAPEPSAEGPSADATSPTEGDPSATEGGFATEESGVVTTSSVESDNSTVPAVVPVPPAVVSRVENLKLACDTGTKKQIKQSVRFAEVQNCSWNQNGNLGQLDMHVQAVEGQKATIELPVNARLCELGIGSAATTIQYDDFMVLTLNNQVLLSSNKELLVDIDKTADLPYSWDFSRVRGKAINWDAPSYCLGNDASLCNVPVTDVQGSFQFNIDPSSLGKLAGNSIDTKKLDFALYSTGDNDVRDCWHTAFTLDFTLSYVE